ncbi:Neuronal membrane glycoprotein M6-a [Amphibalanus amphitrite]|uniref:Neuronal membrane glycoprotein M6-a n=1 Tax=Amphibalanus amphitrite TaxID=1232801 RepID=A0A6A4VXU9_AMPAM|nr:neuronal membrane glycoprotein M6-a-like [Amphibalanus amphitrite]XP_043220691.1 neuronal membrane glycoprotein M6-a-like [Amphibalanus amphitrite]KAF0296210.1 Neuronal membrane glycoprotein M6-a [Amphibalanus amphitrite]
MSNGCRSWMLKMPYATLLATLLCIIGVGVFCGCIYRVFTLCLRMFDEVFHFHLDWLEPVQLVCMIVGVAMAALGIMILLVGCLTTGSTRARVFRSRPGRARGRTSCAVFMGVAYILQMAWMLMFGVLVIGCVMFAIFWNMCLSDRVQVLQECIDFRQFAFVFPNNTREEDMQVCGAGEQKLFCKDYVENIQVNLVLSAVGCFLVLLSLVNYLMCLAANYAHIKDQEKFVDLSEMQYLQVSEPGTLAKDRF